jgi:hypothetical protein
MNPPPPFKLPFAPRRLVLFSGHMMDAPGRAEPRFPPALEAPAQARIDAALQALHCDQRDMAITQGAAGGDLLFAEACVRRGIALQLLLPLSEDEFIATSILPSAHGREWRRRYLAVKAALAWPPYPMPAASGDPFERCNQWMLATAAASGAEHLHVICLWDGGGGDGPGGTAHMVRELQAHGAEVTWIDTRTLG